MATLTGSVSLEERLRKNPGSLAFSRLADLYRTNGDIEQAIEVCTKGIEKHPDYLTARLVLGRCYLDRKDLEKAAEAFTLVCRKDRRNGAAIKQLAHIFRQQGLPEKAKALNSLLSKMDPYGASLSRPAERDGVNSQDLLAIIGPYEEPAAAPVAVAKTVTEMELPAEVAESPAGATSILRGETSLTPALVFDAVPKGLEEEIVVQAEAQPLKAEEVLAEAEAITGNDVSDRMAEIFNKKLPSDTSTAPADETDTTEPFAAPVTLETDETLPTLNTPAEVITGSDVSERMYEIFEKKPSDAPQSASVEEANEPQSAAPETTEILAALDTPALVEEAPPAAQHDGAETIEETPSLAEETISSSDISERMANMFGSEPKEVQSSPAAGNEPAETSEPVLKTEEPALVDEVQDGITISSRIDALFSFESSESPQETVTVEEIPLVSAHEETIAPSWPADMDLEETMIIDADITRKLSRESLPLEKHDPEPLVVDSADTPDETGDENLDFFSDEAVASALPFPDGEELIVDEEETLDDLLCGIDAPAASTTLETPPSEPPSEEKGKSAHSSPLLDDVSGDDVVERLDGIFGKKEALAVLPDSGQGSLRSGKTAEKPTVEEETIRESAPIISGNNVEERIDEFFSEATEPAEKGTDRAEITEMLEKTMDADGEETLVEELRAVDDKPLLDTFDVPSAPAMDETIVNPDATVSLDPTASPEETHGPIPQADEQETLAVAFPGAVGPEEQKEKNAIFEEF
jgi:tetratricopeptide (TPR) repeat protein